MADKLVEQMECGDVVHDFYLHDLEHITLDFGGAVLCLYGKLQPFVVDRCRDITIQNRMHPPKDCLILQLELSNIGKEDKEKQLKNIMQLIDILQKENEDFFTKFIVLLFFKRPVLYGHLSLQCLYDPSTIDFLKSIIFSDVQAFHKLSSYGTFTSHQSPQQASTLVSKGAKYLKGITQM